MVVDSEVPRREPIIGHCGSGDEAEREQTQIDVLALTKDYETSLLRYIRRPWFPKDHMSGQSARMANPDYDGEDL